MQLRIVFELLLILPLILSKVKSLLYFKGLSCYTNYLLLASFFNLFIYAESEKNLWKLI